MLKKTWCGVMIALGWLALALGFVGVFLPLLPTTPFVLLAAFFFSRGSERLHRWLRDHPRFGSYVRDWEAEQVIPPVGKYAGTLMMLPSVGYALATRDIPAALEVLMVVTLAAVLWFIWSRPSRRSRPTERASSARLALDREAYTRETPRNAVARPAPAPVTADYRPRPPSRGNALD
jgi:uncharacterized membrane protein YbaN (DUF454 family)